MLSLFTGTDREKARAALEKAVKAAKKTTRVYVSDASSEADVRAALQGGGLFALPRAVVLDGVLASDKRAIVMGSLAALSEADDAYFILEEKPDAQTRKTVEKFADVSEKYDAPAKQREGSIFELANALRRADKRRLWIALQREYLSGAAPEAVHGALFWGAKDMALKSRGEEQGRAKKLVAMLAELPHEARRRGEDLEYALERFALSTS